MNKVKINTGLASIILVASLFAGWEGMILLVILLFAFCEIDENVKNVALSVITFYVGYTIVSVGWDVIMAVVNAIVSALTGFASFMNTYLDPLDYISVVKITTPISYIASVLDSIVTILLLLAKIGFVIATLTGKQMKKNILVDKISNYVSKASDYVTNQINSASNTQTSNQNNNINV